MNTVELPKYKSHKIVWALFISGIEIHADKSATIAPKDDGYEPFKTREGWAERFEGDEEDLGVYEVYEDGFTSWSPTEVFKNGYEKIISNHKNPCASVKDFGWAIRQMKAGKKVQRIGWNGKGMFIFLLEGNDNLSQDIIHDPYLKKVIQDKNPYKTTWSALPSIRMFTADGKVLTGWLASQTDILSEDWEIVE